MSSEMASTDDLGIPENEMHEYMESERTGVGNAARQVCICGHALARHSTSEITSYCSVGRAWCSCAEVLPVLETDDLRTFVYSTEGIGKKHALAKGLYALRKNGRSARWIIERFCFRCGANDSVFIPAALTREKRVARGTGYSNALLCESCVVELGGSMYSY